MQDHRHELDAVQRHFNDPFSDIGFGFHVEEPLEIVGAENRDELLSDALHLYDVAMGLDRPSVHVSPSPEKAPADATDRQKAFARTRARIEKQRAAKRHVYSQAPQPFEPRSAVEEAMERSLATQAWGRVQDWRELQFEQSRPVMTADDRDDVHGAQDTRPLVGGGRWVDGAACWLAVETDAQADSVLLVEPMSVETDLIVEQPRAIAELIVEGGEELPLTMPEHSTMVRYYAHAFLSGSRGVRALSLRGIERQRLHRHPWVREQLLADVRLAERVKAARAKLDTHPVACKARPALQGSVLRSTHELTSHADTVDEAKVARRDRLVTDLALPRTRWVSALDDDIVPIPGAHAHETLPAWALRQLTAERHQLLSANRSAIGPKAPAKVNVSDRQAGAQLRGLRRRVLAFDRYNHVNGCSDRHFDLGQGLAVDLANVLAAA